MIYLVVSFLIVAFGQPAWFGGWFAPFAALFGYALFWIPYKGKFWAGTLWFFAVQLVQLSWMTSIEFQGIYILFIYAALSFWLGLQFGALTLLVKEKMPPSRILAVASLWTVLEWGRMHILCGFSFNPSGLALATLLPSVQFAALFGVLGLSFWVMLVNLTFLRKKFVLWGVLAAFPYLFGLLHLFLPWKEGDKEISVALVQTGLLPSEKVPLRGRISSFISPYEQWQRIIRYLKQVEGNHLDFIVLPEAAVPFMAEQNAYSAEAVEAILKSEGIALPSSRPAKVSNAFWMHALATHFQSDVIVGMDGEDFIERKNFAAAYHLSLNERRYNRYEKRILVPLAEYIPFLWLKPLVAAYGIGEFFTQGAEAKVFTNKIPFSLSICYEETFPDIMREGRVKGAELFINLTNDNWYPESRLPQQHFDLGRLRAVENGVPLIRACNSGVTAAIDSFGRVLATFEGKSGVLATVFKVDHHKTFYTFWGDAGIICLSLAFLVIYIRFSPFLKINL